jgi:hypothetical protein
MTEHSWMRFAAANPERIAAQAVPGGAPEPTTGKTKMQRAGSFRLPPFAHQPFSLGLFLVFAFLGFLFLV